MDLAPIALLLARREESEYLAYSDDEQRRAKRPEEACIKQERFKINESGTSLGSNRVKEVRFLKQ